MSSFRGFSKSDGAKAAKHASNQPTLDHLRAMAKEPRYANSAHYPQVFKRGMAALAKAAGPVRTVEEAQALSGVGPFLAKIVAGVASREAAGGGGEPAEALGRNGRARPAPAQAPAPAPALALRKRQRTGGGGDPTWPRPRPRPRPQPEPQPAKPSAKRKAYDRAVMGAEELAATLDQYGDWRVILLVDQRERKADHVRAKLLMSGVEAEVRTLPIGDMLWIARGERREAPSSHPTGTSQPQTVEVVLGTVVERKTLDDLAKSLFGTRFEEQRLRLKNSASGASQVLYLVEADGAVGDLPNCSGATLRYAMMDTMINLGFAVVRTRSLEDTVRYLRRVHRRLMRRSFPAEFRSVDDAGAGREIPSFLSPDGRARRTAASAEAEKEGELVFQSTPMPFEAPRLTPYEEFKAKIELARETGTRSVLAVHRAMLKQVEGMSVKKVTALTDAHDTPSSLVAAYRGALSLGGQGGAEALAKEVKVGRGVIRNVKIGPKASAELARVYTTGASEELLSSYVDPEHSLGLDNATEASASASASAPSPARGRVSATATATATAPAAASSAASSTLPSAGPTMADILRHADIDLSSDEEEAHVRTTPRRVNIRKRVGPANAYEDRESGEGPARKPPARAPEESGSARTRTAKEAASSNRSSLRAPEKFGRNECFDLTMESSDEDGGHESLAAATETSHVGFADDPWKPAASKGRFRPRLSYDKIDGSDSDSDSDFSCDDLLVKMKKRVADKAIEILSSSPPAKENSAAGGKAPASSESSSLSSAVEVIELLE